MIANALREKPFRGMEDLAYWIEQLKKPYDEAINQYFKSGIYLYLEARVEDYMVARR